MKKVFVTKTVLLVLLVLLTGCGKTNEETSLQAIESEELLDAFLSGEVPAIYIGEEESVIKFSDLTVDEEDWFSYSVGERIDLDNDGENEQIMNGPYGGKYFDARVGKVYVLAEGDGTAQTLSYTDYDNAVWIVHSEYYSCRKADVLVNEV